MLSDLPVAQGTIVKGTLIFFKRGTRVPMSRVISQQQLTTLPSTPLWHKTKFTFRFLGTFAQSCKAPITFVISVRLSVWNLTLHAFIKISRENPKLNGIGKKILRTLHEDLSTFHCCQPHYIVIQVLSSTEMVSGCPSICPHASARLPRDEFTWYFTLRTSTKISLSRNSKLKLG